jgi:acyl-CoA thioesterase I
LAAAEDTADIHRTEESMRLAFFRAWTASIVLLASFAGGAASASPITIVAIGASNTWGWGVGQGSAYPERLQAMLKAKGYDVNVINAGVNFNTTNGMLERIDSAVPEGTRIVILQPGGNDLRFFGTKEQRSQNIAAMANKVRARKMSVIVFDPVIPSQYYQWDGIHITAEGHNWIASSLLPQVTAILGAKSPAQPGAASDQRMSIGAR